MLLGARYRLAEQPQCHLLAESLVQRRRSITCADAVCAEPPVGVKVVISIALMACLRSAVRVALVKGQTTLTVPAAPTVFVALQTTSCLDARLPRAIDPRAATTIVPGPVTFNVVVIAALEAVGLGALTGRLDEEAPWAQRLSGGEQQRVAVARALLARPDWLFLDEATASLDPEAEAQLYALLRRSLPNTTIVSIAHRPSVADLHDRRLVLEPGAGGGRLREVGPGA